MSIPPPPYKAAAVQAEPVWNDLSGGVTKTIDLIAEAHQQGVSLLAFPELWIPGYPLWIFLGHPMGGLPNLGPALMASSLEVGGAAWQQLSQAAVDKQVTVVLGASLVDHGRVFMGQAFFFADGSAARWREKIEPTSFEKTLFKAGDEVGVAVHDVPGIGRLGALQCFEHLQAENRMRLQGQYEQVHVASWPVLAGPAPETYILSVDANLAVSKSYAIENGAWTIAAMGMLSDRASAQLAAGDPARQAILAGAGQGYAQVIAPNGMPVGAPLKPDEEGLVIAEIDLNLISAGKLFYDPMGSERSRQLRQQIATI